MKAIASWQDLEEFGIIVLTGEACGLSLRILCDVTDRGRKILGKCFGIPDMTLGENWNRGTETEPHVGSVMLAPEFLSVIGIFALLESGCTEAWLSKNGDLLGIEPGDPPEQVQLWAEFRKPQMARTFAYRGTAADRNVHVMSGRIE